MLPFLALLCAQLFTSSWHVLGKHIMLQVRYLCPIAYILIRTLISATLLFTMGRIYEGPVKFPQLFKQKREAKSPLSGTSIESGNSIGMTVSPSVSTIESMCSSFSITDKKIEDLLSNPSQQHTSSHFHRPRRRKGRSSKGNNSCTDIIGCILYLLLISQKECARLLKDVNTEALQIVAAGTAGMLLLPSCYTTGLIITSPTIASVWDGPMIPLGCFCAAVVLKLEKRSEHYPMAQIGSLLLAVGGSLIVLMADFIHGNDHKNVAERDAGMNHVQFIQGNIVLSGVVAAYSATALLQKQLTHYPPITLTSWMFGIGFLGCFGLLLLDSVLLGGTLTGCTLGQAVSQLHLALTTSPTFQYGLLYSALFVGGACFAIASYASAHLESSVITLFAACQPPMTAFLEWIWEGKGFGWKKVFGMCCVCCGMCGFTYIKRLESHLKKVQHA
jgi:drug/metabolite transporter (DMT)-like permease